MLGRVRAALLPDFDTLRIFGDVYRERLALAAFATGAAGIFGIAAFTYFFIPVNLEQYVRLETFYPITVYPGPLQVVVQLTPLYHGVELLRSLTTGIIGPSILVDMAYLVVLGAAALLLAATRLQRLLLK